MATATVHRRHEQNVPTLSGLRRFFDQCRKTFDLLGTLVHANHRSERAAFPAFETLLFQSVRAESANRNLGYELFHWRTSDDVEVDLVAYGERGFHAFEVKRTHVFREADLKGLKVFIDDYPQARGHLFYGGARSYDFGSIQVMPLTDGLVALPHILSG